MMENRAVKLADWMTSLVLYAGMILVLSAWLMAGIIVFPPFVAYYSTFASSLIVVENMGILNAPFGYFMNFIVRIIPSVVFLSFLIFLMAIGKKWLKFARDFSYSKLSSFGQKTTRETDTGGKGTDGK